MNEIKNPIIIGLISLIVALSFSQFTEAEIVSGGQCYTGGGTLFLSPTKSQLRTIKQSANQCDHKYSIEAERVQCIAAVYAHYHVSPACVIAYERVRRGD